MQNDYHPPALKSGWWRAEGMATMQRLLVVVAGALHWFIKNYIRMHALENTGGGG